MLLGRPSRLLGRHIWPNRQIRPFQNDERVLRTTLKWKKKRRSRVLRTTTQNFGSKTLTRSSSATRRTRGCASTLLYPPEADTSKSAERYLLYCTNLSRAQAYGLAIKWPWFQFPLAAYSSQTWEAPSVGNCDEEPEVTADFDWCFALCPMTWLTRPWRPEGRGGASALLFDYPEYGICTVQKLAWKSTKRYPLFAQISHAVK